MMKRFLCSVFVLLLGASVLTGCAAPAPAPTATPLPSPTVTITPTPDLPQVMMSVDNQCALAPTSTGPLLRDIRL